ncbi:MAG: glycerophosphodiester phosphodiesterase family protein, partial [Bradyrhizobium sp.]|nr:glycerophosphodiester phosphodiesterase family protein [Bradyrhizobium sp.]
MSQTSLVFSLLFLGLASPATAFDIQAHRGGRGLHPENTLQAFSRALDLHVDTLELDVGVTRDGVLVVSHERRLNPDLARDA